MIEQLKNKSAFIQVFSIILFGFVLYFIMSIVALLLSNLVLGINLSSLQEQEIITQYPVAFMLVNFIPFQVGFFLIPGYIGQQLIINKNKKFRSKNIYLTGSILVLMFAATVLLLPLLMEINQMILSFFGSHETFALQHELNISKIQDLVQNNYASFITGVISIALITGVSEEYFFRAFLYNHIKQNTSKSYVFAMVISALIFALLHFNYIQFLPLLSFGIILAISYEYGNILISIGLHVANNALNIYWIRYENSPSWMESSSLETTIPSILMIMTGLVLIKRLKVIAP